MYDVLLEEAKYEGLYVKEKPLRGHTGRIMGARIAIKKDIPSVEKACVLAEELGHYYTSVGDILDQTNIQNRKQEQRARNWAYIKMLPLDKFIAAYHAGIKSAHEFAEFAEVTEEFLHEAIQYYQRRYGLYTTHKGYTIYFEKLAVLRMFK